ncbi:hypothetical protein [Dyella nitratireducens]|uniref:Uncharacterized protein n=1 Tax=Dyella nitratireducens TaxID=1849580 RepID=A0ABQ1FPH1_9GAMM|nr:hypothetical protein [Dyella nitratireducens]GGA25166.1 hypothetical protein GCM10010981_12120 [Dyella nitratireducens]GLQ43726.1 hypothetical protein GCM10007902_35760 [Dyella nitratireducens]
MIRTNSSTSPMETQKLLDGIARGERALNEGRTFTIEQAKDRLRKWLGNSTETAAFPSTRTIKLQ